MRDRIWNVRWLAEYNVAYWNRVDCLLTRVDIVIKIVLGLSSVLGLSALAFKPEWVGYVIFVTGFAAILSTVIIPAARWSDMLVSVESIRHQWISIVKQSKLAWDELESGKSISAKRVDCMDEMMIDTGKEKFWIGDIERYRIQAIEEARIILG